MHIIQITKILFNKIGDVFEWSYVEKAQFLYLSSCLVSLYVVALLLLVELLDLLPQHDLDARGSIQLMLWASLHFLIMLSLGLIGFPLRKRYKDLSWYVHSCVQLYGLANIIILYYLGIFSLGAGVALAGGPIAGMLLFPRRTIFIALATGIAFVGTIITLTVNGTIPYAPIISEPGTEHTNLAWLLVVSGLVVPHIVMLLSTSLASINRWQEREEKVRYLSSTDVLTQVANRRHLMEQFEVELSRASRDKTALSVLMVDLDHFKAVNDNYGHQVGDIALQASADLLKEAIRNTDLLGRYGGEEFCIVLPGADLAAAQRTAERCRSNIESADIRADEGKLQLTASFGLATLSAEKINEPTSQLDNLLKEADTALYRAKKQGRNQVVSTTI